MTAVVVIPALNEAASIGRVVSAVRALEVVDEVIVVDDGSTDETATIARDAGASLIRLPYNLGVGGAVRTGLRHSVDIGADRVVIMDADDQHDVADVTALLDAIDAGAGMAIGSRFADGPRYRMGRVRRSAHRLLNRIVSGRTGVRMTDATSGFRAMDADVAALLAQRYPVEYLADTVEVLFLVRRHGHRLVEVPVTMRERVDGRPSSAGPRLVIDYLRLLVGIGGSTLVRHREPTS